MIRRIGKKFERVVKFGVVRTMPQPNFTPFINILDLFPHKSPEDRDRAMIELSDMTNRWLRANGNKTLTFQWTNILERDDNPDGTMGRFRYFHQIPEPPK
jgi:hypothetical protein